MKRFEIHVAPEHFNKLVEETGKSRQTVYNALSYFTNSKLAQNIRARSKEMLLNEASKVEIKVEVDKNV